MEILQRFEEIVKNIKVPIIFEIGTNDGYHTNLMQQILKRVSTKYDHYAFEPDPRLIDIFHNNNKTNAYHFYNYAIGAKTGSFDFHLSSGEEKRPTHVKQHFTGSSSLRKPKNVLTAWPDMQFHSTKVQVITLDDFMTREKISKIDFIWMDVQGCEIDVFEGAKNSLSKIRYIFTEYCDSELYEGEIGLKEILKMLPTFKLIEDYKGDVLLKNENFNQ